MIEVAISPYGGGEPVTCLAPVVPLKGQTWKLRQPNDGWRTFLITDHAVVVMDYDRFADEPKTAALVSGWEQR